MYNEEYWKNRYSEVGGERTVGRHNWSKKEYDDFLTTYEEPLRKLLLNYTHGGLVLDFGCGIGRWIPMLESVFDQYVGIDIVQEAIEIAQNKFSEKQFYLLNDFFENPIGPQSIWTHVVLQHVVDESLFNQYLIRFYEILESKGFVFITESCDMDVFNHYLVFRSTDTYIKKFQEVGFKCLYCEQIIPEHKTFVFQK